MKAPPALATLALTLVTLAVASAVATADVPAVTLTAVAPFGTFPAPILATSPPGDVHRLFVVEGTGQLTLVKDGAPVSQPFLDITQQVESSSNTENV